MGNIRIDGVTGGFTGHKARRSNGSGDFSDFVKEAVASVNTRQIKAEESVEKLATGQTGIHEAMIALQKADISLRFLLQVRNKAMEAYREVMRMQF